MSIFDVKDMLSAFVFNHLPIGKFSGFRQEKEDCFSWECWDCNSQLLRALKSVASIHH